MLIGLSIGVKAESFLSLMQVTANSGIALLVFVYLVPIGHAIGFLGGLGWLLSLPGKPFHWAIFLSTQLYMSMIYIAVLGGQPFAIFVGMPILTVATVVLLFVAGVDVFGGDTTAKVLVGTGMLAFAGGFFATEVPYLPLVLWVLTSIILEIGYFVGMKRARDAAKTEKVYLVDSKQPQAVYGTYVPQESYGSVQVITTA